MAPEVHAAQPLLGADKLRPGSHMGLSPDILSAIWDCSLRANHKYVRRDDGST
jgi:hypothetical protein